MKPETLTFKCETPEDYEKAIAELRARRRDRVAAAAAKDRENKAKAARAVGEVVLSKLPEWKTLDLRALDGLLNASADRIGQCCNLDGADSDAALRRILAAKKTCIKPAQKQTGSS